MTTDDLRVEDARGDSSAGARKLTAAGSQRRLPPRLDKMSSRTLLKQNQSLKRIDGVAAPLRRPSTATSAHSRAHQALRRSESEFVFSSKVATVEGFLYSSRFQQAASARPSNSQAMVRSKHTQMGSLDKRASASTPEPKSPPRSPSQEQRRSQLPRVSSLLDNSLPHKIEQANATKTPKPRPLSSPHLLRKHRRDQDALAVPGSNTREETPSTPTTALSVAKNDDGSYVLRKRRCARTFEEMIIARVQAISKKASPASNERVCDDPPQPNKDDDEATNGIDKLLANGIIPSVIALSSLPDAATQSHCCRALYYLAQVPSARKPMVSNGAVGTIKILARTAAVEARQDLAAALCHLCEEGSLIEAMLFEGIDRCLVRLIGTAHSETKRICALAVFNISSDANKIKHFVDAFSQLLITSTKSSYGHTAASGYLMKAVYNVARLPMFHASLLGENIPRFLASQLPHMSGSIQILALQALVSLCDAKANRAQILSQGFCRLLEKMLTVSNGDVQEMALLVLLLLSLDEGSCIKLCNWLPIGTFVHTASARLAHQPTSSLVFLDSCIVRNLCDSVLTHHELLEENAMPLLLDMSRVSNHSIKANAVCALVSIIASSPEESAEYVTEILDELITLTQSQQPRICLFAVGAIYNIACNDDCLPLLARSTDLIDCLRRLAIAPEQESVAELAAAVIYRLGTLDINKDCSSDAATLLLERNFFPVLIQLVRSFPAARGYAVQALLQLTQSDKAESHESLFPHGSDGIWELLCALTNESDEFDKSAPSTCDDPAAARSAVALIAVLSQHRVNHRLLVKNGVVFRFLRSLRRVARDPTSNDETIVLNSAYVFYSLAISQEGCEQLIREQGIEEMIYIARTAKFADTANTHHVKELFMMTMCRVSSFIGLEVKLIEHGAIDAVMVLALVSSTDSASIKALCIKTLANCLVAKNCAQPLIDHGVIWALASLVVVDSVDTRAACAVSLCNLATVPHMLGRFLDAGAPRALVHLLQKCEHEQANALIVVKTIANLVANEKICLAFVNEDIEKHLGVYFASEQSSNEMRQLAAMVLLRVTSANDAVISLEHLKHGVFVWMEQIITMEDDALVKNCMLTVHDLTCSTTIDIAELDVDHILRIVIQVFQRHARSGDVLTMCLWTLYNLSCQLRVLHELVRPEILEFLRRQVPAVALPFPLPYPSTGVAHLAASSSTLSLINGAVVQSIDVKLCCYVLHNLSCARDGNNVLASLVNARMVAILSDVYLQRDDLKETCAVAACNLAIGRVNSTRVVDDRAGELVIHFAFSNLFHRCHYHLVSVAIRKMVNAPGNQPLLLHRGVAQAIVRVLDLAAAGGAADIVTVRNLIASVCVLSKCKTHLPRLLQDGVLPVVVAVSESKAVTSGNNAIGSEILGFCFEILSELCSVDFESFETKTVDTGEEINVINTLTRLSELHHVSSSSGGQSPATGASYYDRGDDASKCLAFAQLLTCMKKTSSTTNSMKKNLELQASFQVPARKWMPDAQLTPHDPPSLECCEIPLTDGSQSMPDEIRQRIKSLPPLPKECLIRNESSETEVAVDPTAASLQQETQRDNSISPATDEAEQGENATRVGPAPLLSEIRSKKKQLQRGLAGRNLSLASTSSLLF